MTEQPTPIDADTAGLLLRPEELPSWISRGHWTWKGHTTVLGSVTPDGYLLGREDGERFGLDLIAIENPFEVGNILNVSSLLPLAAHILYAEGSIAVLHDGPFGAPTLLYPTSEFNAANFVDAIRRFAFWAGADMSALNAHVELSIWHPVDYKIQRSSS